MKSESPWMIYGANGYTGRLIAEAAVAKGLKPVLAGRSESSIKPLADTLSLPWKAFSLDDQSALVKDLKDMKLVAHCAGPFSATSRPMVNACLQAGAHYVDITGEIEVLEAVLNRSEEAKKAGVVLLPGAGFDVVPSDCLAAWLKEKLPDADHLELAFAAGGHFSRGTLSTMIETFPRGGKIRKNGQLTRVPAAFSTKKIPFADRARTATTIPWGDVSSAFHSTAIPNIMVYTATSRRSARWMRRLSPLAPLSGLKPIQRLLKARLKDHQGPTQAERQRITTQLWGRVTGPSGNEVSATLEVPEGYELTIHTTLEIVERLRRGDVPAGAWTPSKAFGNRFILEFTRARDFSLSS